MKHTSGPWKKLHCPCAEPACRNFHIVHAVIGIFTEADADLICAAPNMLKILEGLEEVFVFQITKRGQKFHSELQCIRDVIAESKGE